MQEDKGPFTDPSTGSRPIGQRESVPGLGTPPAGLTWYGYLLQLLHIASSIEHALMVQYLYAAYSLDERKDKGERTKVALWRNLILNIAKEEMGHLLTVQNVLCLLGGQMELVRRNYPWDSGFYPFEFRLEPLSVGSLACYLYAEMGDEPAFGSKLLDKLYLKLVQQHLSKRAENDAKLLGQPVRARKTCKSAGELCSENVHKVGELYKRIIAIIGNPQCIDDALFRRDSIRFQASADEWGRGYGVATRKDLPLPKFAKPRRELKEVLRVLTAEPTEQRAEFISRLYKLCRLSKESKLSKEENEAIADDATRAAVMIERVATRQQAVEALKNIAAQGEGAIFGLQSHFVRFSFIMEDFQEMRRNQKKKNKHRKEWEPWTHAVATDPRTPWPDEALEPSKNEPVRASIIRHPLSEKWAHLFNLRYRMLLTYLSHACQLARDGSEARRRGHIMNMAFAEMYNLKAIAGILVRLPLTDRKKDKSRAGPPFQMPYTLAIPTNRMDCWRLHSDLLEGAIGLNCQIVELSRDQINSRNRDPTLTATFLGSTETSLRAMKELDEQSSAWIHTVLGGLSRSEVLSP